MIPCTSCGRLRPHTDAPCPDCCENRVGPGTQERLDLQPLPAQSVGGGTAAPQVHSAAPAPTSDIDDPFGFSPDVTETLDPPSQDELDAAADLRARRDRASAKRKATTRKKSDLESKTRELLRSMGYRYGRTETVGFTGMKKDLFGFVDGIGVSPTDVLFVQTTSRDNYAAHVKKMATGDYKIGNGTPTPCFDVAACFILLASSAEQDKKADKRPLVRFAIVVWDQPGGPGTAWRHEFKYPTLEELEHYRARSRSRGAA